jgi:hypothetical protein
VSSGTHSFDTRRVTVLAKKSCSACLTCPPRSCQRNAKFGQRGLLSHAKPLTALQACKTLLSSALWIHRSRITLHVIPCTLTVVICLSCFRRSDGAWHARKQAKCWHEHSGVLPIETIPSVFRTSYMDAEPDVVVLVVRESQLPDNMVLCQHVAVAGRKELRRVELIDPGS